MNRQIKFRVWDKSLIKFFYTDNPFSVRENETGGYSLVFSLNNDAWKGEYIIQQYTGLKDKNGEEIYEGDIVQSGLHMFRKHGHFTPFYEITFQYGKFRLKHIKSGETSVDFSPHDFPNTLKEEEIEIIGNIFQTPDLLKQ